MPLQSSYWTVTGFHAKAWKTAVSSFIIGMSFHTECGDQGSRDKRAAWTSQPGLRHALRPRLRVASFQGGSVRPTAPAARTSGSRSSIRPRLRYGAKPKREEDWAR